MSSQIERKKKDRKKRAPNKIKDTPALTALYDYFVKPFLRDYHLHLEQFETQEGYEAFFSVNERATLWCICHTSFTMPGDSWLDTSHPYNVVKGVPGRRYVKPGDGVVVRLDKRLPDRNEVEFDEQVFVLTRAQLAHINQYMRIKA